jgi:hypothetical protein
MLEFARLGRWPDEVGKGRIVDATSDWGLMNRSKVLWTLMTETDRAVVLSIGREELQYLGICLGTYRPGSILE